MAPKQALPSMVPFPAASWRIHLVPNEWEACLDAWLVLAGAHLSLSDQYFSQISRRDESLVTFLTSYAQELPLSHQSQTLSESPRMKQLRKQCYLLATRLLDGDTPDELLRWTFMTDLARVYGRKYGSRLVTLAWIKHASSLEKSMASLKGSLIKELDAGLKGDLKLAEVQLKRLNHLLHISSETATFFMAGSDFLDSLITCYMLMNPPLRNAIISTTYLCLVGLIEGTRPQYSTLIDQLYSLQSAAESHKAGPTNVNDSMVAELVTVTPIINIVERKLDVNASGSNRAKTVLTILGAYRKAGRSGRPQRTIRRKLNKGKEVATHSDRAHQNGQIHVHRSILISQIQDLFPDLGSGFIMKLLDEFDDDVEQVTARLLEESLPPRFRSANRSEELTVGYQFPGDYASDLESHSSILPSSSRRNIFDDDEFDRLEIDTSRLHLGQRQPEQTADDILNDRSNAPNKAAILSALAAFDSDDDERDDTYDVVDVGGTVDSATPGNNPEEGNVEAKDAMDETLFRAYKAIPALFGRDAATRRGDVRNSLRRETGMTDEAIEGWALMLSRDPRQMRRLEAKFSNFKGVQRELAPTSWKPSPAGSGTEDSDIDGNHRGGGGIRGRGTRGGRGRGRGNVAGPTGEKDTEIARNQKAANKGSRANHNRRDQRAKKMARGGFPG